ncbi:hypothetical protein GCM10010503_36570 [Streptomyces lucensis JCM 4490]|uniref:ABC transporter ATP-binding protein n=1 Tax=Streptomyces lucensis JCM 4490 TaxID=1306176 RepID=A0A918J889_9ACTN|nr:hypothetical protein GCM10010503_36570 [Streptomyces lucensis JCM 4490]
MDETGLALFWRRRIGMIFQFFDLSDDLTTTDNVALAAQLTATTPGAGRAATAMDADSYPALIHALHDAERAFPTAIGPQSSARRHRPPLRQERRALQALVRVRSQ